MKLTCLGSGSDGNSYVLEQNGSRIILDVGKPWKEVLKACEYDVFSIEAALITHEHGDHAKYIKDFHKAGIPIFGNLSTKEKFHCVRTLATGRRVDVGNGWYVIPFEVPHTHGDGTACQNYAYLIERNCERILYMTDWEYCKYRLSKFNINHFLIAINYTDLEDDGQGGIHHVMQGHSSLDTALEFLRVNVTDNCRSVIACHVSERNGDELKIMEGLVNTAPTVRTLAVAKKGTTYQL